MSNSQLLGQIEEKLELLNRECPLIPHTNSSRLYSTVRRMKAEKEMGIPVEMRSGFAISTKIGKSANKMTDSEWDDFYKNLCNQLKREYPDLYARLLT